MHIVFGGNQQLEVKPIDHGKVYLVFNPGWEMVPTDEATAESWQTDADTWRVRRAKTNALLTPRINQAKYRDYDLITYTTYGKPDDDSPEIPRQWGFYVNFEYVEEEPAGDGRTIQLYLDGKARVLLQRWGGRDDVFQVLVTIGPATIRLHPAGGVNNT